MTSDQSKTSLRDLAKQLGCGHSALSKAVRERRLTAGVRLDARGRVIVIDAAAAAAQWRSVHIVRVDEMERRQQVSSADPRRNNEAAADRAVVVTDEGSFTARDITGADMRRQLAEWGSPIFNELSRQDLIERWVTFDVLATMLVEAGLAGDRDTFVERITAALRAAAPRLHADAELLADAEALLRELVENVLNPETHEPEAG